MQILILTPIHPMQIAEMVGFISEKYAETVDTYSIQSMALLAEETLEKEYVPTSFVYAAEIRKNPNLILNTKYKKPVQIVYGNLDKNTKIKFDHVLAYTGHYGENDDAVFDPYLSKAQSLMDPVFLEKRIPKIEWYTQEDSEHTFPTLHHLEKFLDVIGVPKNAVQFKSTESN